MSQREIAAQPVDPEAFPASLADWPMFGWVDDVRPALAEALKRKVPSVLATLHTVIGGSPRPAGSQMLIVEDELYGFLSGGCIEADVALHAAQTLQSGRPHRLAYGDGSPFADIRLVCGGRVEVLLERIDPDDAAARALLHAYDARKPAVWASDGFRRLCDRRRDAGPAVAADPLDLAYAALDAAPDAAMARVDGAAAIAMRYSPARRLVVVGHDPTALAIACLAAQSGFEAHLVRPKGPRAPPPLAGVRYHRGAAAEALAALDLDPWTYVALATHSLEADEEALTTALSSQAGYVGALGARRRLPERLSRLRARGLSAEQLSLLHAPIGLDIGGKAPFEIGISVLAEVVAEINRTRPSGAIIFEGGRRQNLAAR